MKAQMIDVGQVRLHVVTAGEGPPVVLLHGFPSYWQTWRHQIGHLAAAGFHVIAPDLRGYNLSEKPKGHASYSLDKLAGDIVGLVRAMGYERATLVGHDWGAVVAWATAISYPSVVERLVVLSVTHPKIMRKKMRKPAQLLKFWYMFFFQLPWLPELLLRKRSTIERSLRRLSAQPEAFDEEDVRGHLEAIRQPGAATGALNYYRAMFRNRQGLRSGPVQPPTLVIWGDRDPIVAVDLLEGIESVGPDVRVHHVANAGHWPHVECPDEVNHELLTFLSRRRV